LYKIKGTNNLLSPLSTVLENRNIEDKERFLNPSKEDVIHYTNLKNIGEAVELLNEHIESKSSIAVVVDSDADGYTSASILIQYLRKMFLDINVTFLMHDGRQNGLTKHIMKQIDKLKPNLVLLPDASSNDYKQHKQLKSEGIDVICLDHHEVENGESEDAIVVSPQLSPLYTNKDIAGVGVTFKFLEALDDKYGVKYADDFLDLVALGNVTDSMLLTSPETRYLCYKGFKNIKNPFLKELMLKHTEWTNELYPKIISWNLVPPFNALIRVGHDDEKEIIFRAMLGEKENSVNTRTGRTETLAQKAVRLCTNAKAKQKRVKDKIVEEIGQKVETEKLNENAFLVIKMDKFEKGLSGYIAGELTKLYKKPVLMMTWNEEQKAYMGSLRGYGDVVTDLKHFLTELNLFNFIAGHANAAGISISKENSLKLNEAINNRLEIVDGKEKIEVDFEFESRLLNANTINGFESIVHYWGKGASEPVVAVKNVEINTKDINFGNIMKVSIGGVELIQFSVDDRLYDLSKDNKTVVCDIVGKVGINRFRNSETPQFVIESIAIKEVKDTARFVF
jgi:single-stranded-DNA-specific exonuclease